MNIYSLISQTTNTLSKGINSIVLGLGLFIKKEDTLPEYLVDNLLLETGDNFLLETGDFLLLE